MHKHNYLWVGKFWMIVIATATKSNAFTIQSGPSMEDCVGSPNPESFAVKYCTAV